MQMVSTKTEEQDSPCVSYDPRPRLHLCDAIVEKLGLKGIPAPGTVFTLHARVVAARVEASAEEAEDDKAPDVSLSLVFTDIGIAPATVSDEQRATMLYGGR